MIEAFLELTPEERVAEAEKRLNETLERMVEVYQGLKLVMDIPETRR